VGALFELGANIEEALDRAEQNGREAVVQILVELGASVEAKDRDGRIALHRVV
jgi:ankyrin repeat protein